MVVCPISGAEFWCKVAMAPLSNGHPEVLNNGIVSLFVRVFGSKTSPAIFFTGFVIAPQGDLVSPSHKARPQVTLG